jgi:hypothetical protein
MLLKENKHLFNEEVSLYQKRKNKNVPEVCNLVSNFICTLFVKDVPVKSINMKNESSFLFVIFYVQQLFFVPPRPYDYNLQLF